MTTFLLKNVQYMQHTQFRSSKHLTCHCCYSSVSGLSGKSAWFGNEQNTVSPQMGLLKTRALARPLLILGSIFLISRYNSGWRGCRGRAGLRGADATASYRLGGLVTVFVHHTVFLIVWLLNVGERSRRLLVSAPWQQSPGGIIGLNATN